MTDASLFEAAGSPSPSLLSPRTLASEDRSTSGPEAGGENSSNASPGIPEDRRQSNTTVLQGDQARGSLQSEVPRESEDPYEVRAGKSTTASSLMPPMSQTLTLCGCLCTVISNIETLESPFRSSRNSSPSGYDAEDQHSCNSRRIDESHRQRDFFPMGSNYIGDEQNQQVFFEHERGDEEFDGTRRVVHQHCRRR